MIQEEATVAASKKGLEGREQSSLLIDALVASFNLWVGTFSDHI